MNDPAHVIAELALNMAPNFTSGDLLLALRRAYDAGDRAGYLRGYEAANAQTNAIFGMLDKVNAR